jgi:YidC/Oxa1 family membrane protein insertase
MDDQNRNLILATALSFLVILVWFVLFPPPAPEEAPAPPATEMAADGTPLVVPPADGALVVPPADGAVPATPELAPTAPQAREAALAASPRVPVRTARLEGSLSLTGGRIDDLRLTDYFVTVAPGSPMVTLLSPAGAPHAYYALYGWAPAGGLGFEAVPGPATEWQLESGEVLTETTPVTLVWDNGAGLVFRRTMAVDANYMFTITQSVENLSGAEVRLQPYGIIARHGTPPDLRGFYILHEGAIMVADGTLVETSYSKIADFEPNAAERAAASTTEVTSDGWIGFTDHYWMSTLVPPSGQSFTAVTKHNPVSDTFQTDVRLPVMAVPPGTLAEATTSLFAGAKEWETIRDYQEEMHIDRFVDAIDWGWFFFLTKPIFRALHFLNGLIGNMGWAIIGLTFVIKALLFPLAYKSYASMSKMKQLQPEMEKIKERVGDDRMKMQQEVMALYKSAKVNPAAGCLPILLQIPIFFSLYKVIFVTLELRHAPFIGWIHDLSAPDPTSILNLFGLLPWAAPGPTSFFFILSIGVWPILMGISMWLQMKLNPAPTDKTQAMIFAWMPWIFMFMLGRFASGLVIYWVANNIITFTQQYTIMRHQGVKPDVMSNILGPLKRLRKAE